MLHAICALASVLEALNLSNTSRSHQEMAPLPYGLRDSISFRLLVVRLCFLCVLCVPC